MSRSTSASTSTPGNRVMVQTFVPASVERAARIIAERTGRSISSVVAEMAVEGATLVARRLLHPEPDATNDPEQS